jgi:nucleotide-binding universal stress UspA family protein
VPRSGIKEIGVFKHILIPSDGSELSAIAVKNGVAFAKEINAKITGLSVTLPYRYLSVDAVQISDTEENYMAQAQAQADRNLSVLKEAAGKAGVEYVLLHRSSEHPYEEIVNAAQERQCDVIFMASHGRRGIAAVILGSETQKVLTHTKIPVLVFR